MYVAHMNFYRINFMDKPITTTVLISSVVLSILEYYLIDGLALIPALILIHPWTILTSSLVEDQIFYVT